MSIKKNPFCPVDIVIFTEGTYPFCAGGVSTVIHQIIESHSHFTFGIIHLAWDEHSPQKNLYPELPHMKWVQTIFLSRPEISKNFSFRKFIDGLIARDKKMKKASLIIQSIKDIQAGDISSFIKIYQALINPLSRKNDLENLLTSQEFLQTLICEFETLDFSLNDLFWLQNSFKNLILVLFDRIYPLAQVYHSHTTGYAGLAAAIAALQHHKNFILTEHSLHIRDTLKLLSEEYEKKVQSSLQLQPVDLSSLKIQNAAWGHWFQILGKMTYQQAKEVTYLYPAIAEEAKRYGAPHKRIKIIPNGIREERFISVRKRQNARSQFRFIPRPGTYRWKLSFVGRVVPIKGLLDLIEAIDYLRKITYENFHLDLVGPQEENPAYFQKCLKRVEHLHLEKLINFTGPQRVEDVLAETDIVLLSSHSEALPVTVLEAMVSSIPVISTNVGSVQQVLETPLHHSHGKVIGPAGIIVPPQHPEQLAQSIAHLFSSAEDYHYFSLNGPQRIAHSYRLENIMSLYTEVYKNSFPNSYSYQLFS